MIYFDSVKFLEHIKQHARDKNMTLAQVAALTDVQPAMFSKINRHGTGLHVVSALNLALWLNVDLRNYVLTKEQYDSQKANIVTKSRRPINVPDGYRFDVSGYAGAVALALKVKKTSAANMCLHIGIHDTVFSKMRSGMPCSQSSLEEIQTYSGVKYKPFFKPIDKKE